MAKDVFISYSRKDTIIANKICEAFDKAGITYFIDRQGIGGGMEFPAVLAEAILDCKLMLFLASKNSYVSKFTNSEVTFAFNKKPAGSIIPYIIDDSTLPSSLEFTFSSINIRTLNEHPIESVLVTDICTLLGRNSHKSDTPMAETSSQTGSNLFANRKFVKYLSIVVSVIFVIVLYFIINNGGSKTNNDEKSGFTVSMDSVMSTNDTIAQNVKLEVRRYEREISNFEFLKIEYPVKGSDELLLSIQKWIKETFGKMNILYTGNLSDADSAVDFYQTSLKRQFALPEANTYSLNICVAFEDEKAVTILFHFYLDESDYSDYYGATFRKTDGKIFTKDMIMQQTILPEIRNSFRLFYNAKTDEEFIRIMNSERYNSAPQLYIQDIRLPHNNPWITKDGFEFDYNDGEYSNYYVSEVGGSISFTISSTKMKQYLSDEGKTFVE